MQIKRHFSSYSRDIGSNSNTNYVQRIPKNLHDGGDNDDYVIVYDQDDDQEAHCDFDDGDIAVQPAPPGSRILHLVLQLLYIHLL